MYKLRTKMTFSFISLIAIIIVLIYITSNFMVESVFRNYVTTTRQDATNKVVSEIGAAYNNFSHNWSEQTLDNIGISALENNLIIQIKDINNKVLWDANTHNSGMCISMMNNISDNMHKQNPNFQENLINENYDVNSNNNKIGSVLISYYGPYYYSDNDLNFINNLNKILIIVSIVSLMIAIILGIIFSSRLTKPISKVINAASQISKGNFSEKIKLNSNTLEINDLINTTNNLARTLENLEDLRKRFSEDVAHELRTPISTLQSHLEAMIDGIWEADEKRLISCHEEVLRIGRLINDVENISLVEMRNTVLEKTKFDFNSFFENICLNFDGEFSKKNIKFISKNNYYGEIFADKDKINQVLVNLISNALKYTKADGEVKIMAEQEADFVKITIKDNGIGISKEDLPFVFERFYRADKSRDRKTGGTGLGLTIVKTLVEAHDGTIKIESAEGIGTTVILMLKIN